MHFQWVVFDEVTSRGETFKILNGDEDDLELSIDIVALGDKVVGRRGRL